jgi:hypothetical protein
VINDSAIFRPILTVTIHFGARLDKLSAALMVREGINGEPASVQYNVTETIEEGLLRTMAKGDNEF